MARGGGWNVNLRRRSAAQGAGEILPRWNVNRRRRFAAHHHRGSSSLSRVEATESEFIGKLPFYTALKYMVSSILTLVAVLKSQGKSEGPFDANPVPPSCFLGATFGYCVILGILGQMQSQNENGIRFQILNRAAIAFGLLSTVSLLSIFVPHRFWFVPFIMLAPLPVVLAWPVLVPAFNWLYTEMSKSAFDIIREKVASWARRSGFTQEASLPN